MGISIVLLQKLTSSHINKQSLINSFKTVLACLLGLVATHFLHIEMAQWVVISILIVMAGQYRVGGAIKKGYARLLATVIGGSLAAITLFFFSNNLLFTYIALFIFIFFFAYLASNSKDNTYLYAFGAVTMTIILLNPNPQIKAAYDRIIEILLGVSIAILVTRFVFPIHAGISLRLTTARILLALKEMYQLSICEEKTFFLISKKTDIEEEIVQYFSNQLVLLQEAVAESNEVKKKKLKYILLNRLERRLMRCIYMLHYTLKLSLKQYSHILTTTEFKKLHQSVMIALENLAKKMEKPSYTLPTIDLDSCYQEIILKIRPAFDEYTFENKNKLHAFIFCIGHLIIILNQMHKIISEL